MRSSPAGDVREPVRIPTVVLIVAALSVMLLGCSRTEEIDASKTPNARATTQADTKATARAAVRREPSLRATVVANVLATREEAPEQTRAAEARATPRPTRGTFQTREALQTRKASRTSPTPRSRWIGTEVPTPGRTEEPEPHPGTLKMLVWEESVFTTYGCFAPESDPDGKTEPVVTIIYENPLPGWTPSQALETETWVAGKSIPLRWSTTPHQDKVIRLVGDDAIKLVQHVDRTGRGGYQVIFPSNPGLDRTIPYQDIGTLIVNAQMECFIEWQDHEVLQPLSPTTVQEQRNGRYRYNSSDLRFSLEYPADCGQMNQAGPVADNVGTCTGRPGEIDTMVVTSRFIGLGKPLEKSQRWTTKHHLQEILDGSLGEITGELATEAGHILELAEVQGEDENGDPWNGIVAGFTDREWNLIVVQMTLQDGDWKQNWKSIRESLRTFDARFP